jgi:hypothetical protein
VTSSEYTTRNEEQDLKTDRSSNSERASERERQTDRQRTDGQTYGTNETSRSNPKRGPHERSGLASGCYEAERSRVSKGHPPSSKNTKQTVGLGRQWLPRLEGRTDCTQRTISELYTEFAGAVRWTVYRSLRFRIHCMCMTTCAWWP